MASRPFLLDTSIYIEALRSGRKATEAALWWARASPLWLSSVVLEELYAGASGRDHSILEKFARDFERAQRVLVPTLGDWTQAGKVLAQVAEKHGFEAIGRARLTNDALIATSAARTGITVITRNRRDFSRLAEFCPLRWEEGRLGAGQES